MAVTVFLKMLTFHFSKSIMKEEKTLYTGFNFWWTHY